jgi:membrane protease YdiL (CAAX protease family)
MACGLLRCRRPIALHLVSPATWMQAMNIGWGIPLELGSRRVLRPGKWLPARAIGWAVAMIFAIVLAFGPLLEAIAHRLPSTQGMQFAAHAVGALVVLAAYAALVKIGEGRTPAEISLRTAPGGILAGAAIGAIMFASVMAIMAAFGLYRFDYHGPASAWHAAGLAIESGVLEEVLVRGVVLRIMWRAFGPFAAFGVSAVLFGAGHVGNPGATWFTTACIATEAGVMLGAFYALTGRLWVSIGLHAAWNFTQGYVFGAAVSGGNFGGGLATSAPRSGFPTWLTGGSFGPEASLPAFLICTAVGASVLALAWRNDRFAKPDPAAASSGDIDQTTT